MCFGLEAERYFLHKLAVDCLSTQQSNPQQDALSFVFFYNISWKIYPYVIFKNLIDGEK